MKRNRCADERHGVDLTVNAQSDKPLCLNEISDLEEFQAIVDRERDCGHDAYGVDFKRLHQQDQGLGGCKFHWKCPVGLERTAEIRELRKSKAKSRERVYTSEETQKEGPAR